MQRLLILVLLACVAAAPASRPAETGGSDAFARDNLVAWCIVPFDAAKRNPQQRAEMLARLGLSRVAYDWRDEHIPTFEEEILESYLRRSCRNLYLDALTHVINCKYSRAQRLFGMSSMRATHPIL